MVSKDIATLSQQLQCIELHIHQSNVCILYMLVPDLYILDWLSHHNHTEEKVQQIAGMNINIHTFGMAIIIPVCTFVEGIRNAMSTDAELQVVQAYILRGWLQNKNDLETTL